MQIYFLASETDRPDLGVAIAVKFGERNCRTVAPGQWLVAADVTPKELSDRLNASDGNFGKLIILLVTSYFGWHDKDMWDWLSLKKSET
ncbi:MAG: hypothetical protein GC146_16310 [Limimaricola sp.]|uniref:hypothetical protein n=1 Tax=Limimaricola sp. TaxID=2211665 RepID=UPI001DEF8B82|nr:hypothetical protein [Limimaricola sp.]MBI1418780.1 hypothetical protein [Limimaricola sp.]